LHRWKVGVPRFAKLAKPLWRNVGRPFSWRYKALGSQIHYVDVGAQPHVVGEVPAVVVGIFVDDDVVAVPEPVAAVGEIECADAEIEAAEPEAAGTASGEMPDVAAAEAAGEVAVLPGMIEMHAGIVTAGVVADPFAVGMDVRGVGMSGLVVEVRGGWSRMRNRSGTVGGDVLDDAADGSAMLGKG